jgi:ribosome-associated protein
MSLPSVLPSFAVAFDWHKPTQFGRDLQLALCPVDISAAMTAPHRITDTVAIPPDEFVFRFSRSSGKGGQNVNKVSTRAEVSFDVLGSPSLRESERTLVLSRLRSRIDDRGVLTVASDASRSQWRNRTEALERLCGLLRRALVPETPRVPTHPSRASRRRRREQKERRAAAKRMRRVRGGGNREDE